MLACEWTGLYSWTFRYQDIAKQLGQSPAALVPYEPRVLTSLSYLSLMRIHMRIHFMINYDSFLHL
jgi:hypothetical protein